MSVTEGIIVILSRLNAKILLKSDVRTELMVVRSRAGSLGMAAERSMNAKILG